MPQERPGFKPAETIDYGHKPSMSDRGRGKAFAFVICVTVLLYVIKLAPMF